MWSACCVGVQCVVRTVGEVDVFDFPRRDIRKIVFDVSFQLDDRFFLSGDHQFSIVFDFFRRKDQSVHRSVQQ